jgi:hypothetical protein
MRAKTILLLSSEPHMTEAERPDMKQEKRIVGAAFRALLVVLSGCSW